MLLSTRIPANLSVFPSVLSASTANHNPRESPMQTLRVNGYDMAYLELGKGPPLVCVHGTLGDFRTWSA